MVEKRRHWAVSQRYLNSEEFIQSYDANVTSTELRWIDVATIELWWLTSDELDELNGWISTLSINANSRLVIVSRFRWPTNIWFTDSKPIATLV